MIIPPRPGEKLFDKNGFPTRRFAEWIGRVSFALNQPGEVSGLGTAAYEDVGTDPGDVVQLEEL